MSLSSLVLPRPRPESPHNKHNSIRYPPCSFRPLSLLLLLLVRKYTLSTRRKLKALSFSSFLSYTCGRRLKGAFRGYLPPPHNATALWSRPPTLVLGKIWRWRSQHGRILQYELSPVRRRHCRRRRRHLQPQLGRRRVRMRKKETHPSLSPSRSVSMKTHCRQLKERAAHDSG